LEAEIAKRKLEAPPENDVVWTQVGLDIDGENADDFFGSSVAMSEDGKRIVIGAAGNDGNGSYSGHVRVFDWIDSTWTQAGLDLDGFNEMYKLRRGYEER
jgi:hypothetical protein